MITFKVVITVFTNISVSYALSIDLNLIDRECIFYGKKENINTKNRKKLGLVPCSVNTYIRLCKSIKLSYLLDKPSY